MDKEWLFFIVHTVLLQFNVPSTFIWMHSMRRTCGLHMHIKVPSVHYIYVSSNLEMDPNFWMLLDGDLGIKVWI